MEPNRQRDGFDEMKILVMLKFVSISDNGIKPPASDLLIRQRGNPRSRRPVGTDYSSRVGRRLFAHSETGLSVLPVRTESVQMFAQAIFQFPGLDWFGQEREPSDDAVPG